MYTVKEAPIEGHASAWRVYNDDNFYIAECAIESDARRIARALNREAAMGEVRDAAMKESEDWPRPGIFAAGARYVLEALDAAEVAP